MIICKCSKIFNIYFYLAFMLIAGLCLRLFQLGSQSLWLDEFATIASAKQSSLIDVIRITFITERIPPLYPVFMHFWLKLFSLSELSLRVPSVIAGVATIPVVYLTGKFLFNKNVGVLASFFLTIAPYHIWYSQEGRFFAIFTLFNSLSIYFFVTTFCKAKSINKLGQGMYVASTVVALYINYFMIFTVIGQGLITVLWKVKKNLAVRCFIVLQTVIILLCIPLAIPFFNQATTSYDSYEIFEKQNIVLQQNETSTAPASNTIKNQSNLMQPKLVDAAGFMFCDLPYALSVGLKYINMPPYHWSNMTRFTFIVPSIILYGILIFFGLYVMSGNTRTILLLFLILPVAGVFLLKVFHVYFRSLDTRHILHVLPFFYIVMAVAVLKIKQKWLCVLIFFFIVMSSIISLYILYFDDRTFKDDWRYVASHTVSSVRESDLVLFHGEFSQVGFLISLKTSENNKKKWGQISPLIREIRARDGSLQHFINKEFKNISDTIDRIWFISYYSYPREIKYIQNRLNEYYKITESNNTLGKKMLFELYVKR